MFMTGAVAATLVAGGSFASLPTFAGASKTGAQSKTELRESNYPQWLNNEVRHQLVLLPWFSVFDNLQYSINGTEVTLSGQVINDTLKGDAERAVKNIEGVTRVNNNIQILPVSPNDDGIRRAEFRAIYGDPTMQRYAQGTLLPIHILVSGGHVTLEGVVANQADKDLVNIRANGVPGVFSVTNNLKVESGR
jgi:hyperosmotically inducible protein